jgi:hypothetical protein
MSSRILTLLFLAIAINSASADTDFTPVVKEYTAEGFTYRQLLFKNDKGSVTFTPPQNWTIRGSKDRLQLSPPANSFVEAIIRAAPPSVSPRFDENGLKVLAEQVMREVPAGAQAVQLIKREENPVLMGQNLSYEFVISFQTLGQLFQRSAIFVNCADQQLVFRFTAPKADFEQFNPDFRRSIASWQWIERAATGAGPAVVSK